MLYLHLLAYSILLVPTATSLKIVSPLFKGIRLPKDGARYDFDFIYNYTKYLHGIHRFNSFVTFARPRARFRPNFLVVRSLEQALMEDFNVPVIVWGLERTAKLRNNIGLNNLVFVQISNITDPILDVVDYTLEGLHFISMLFFYKAKQNVPPTAEEIRTFFAWCWSKNMVNVALTFQVIKLRIQNNLRVLTICNQVYKYSPFPTLTVFNLTDDVINGGGSFPVDHIENVQGYIFKTLLYFHPPFVLRSPHIQSCNDSSDCSDIVTGTIGRFYTEYINQIGGKIKIVEYNNLSFTEKTDKILLAAAKKDVHIGVHPFTDVLLNSELSEGSYPIGQTNVCIIVPVRREMPRERYLVRSFQPTVWMFVALTFVALLGIQFILGSKLRTSNRRNPIALCGYAFIATASVMLDQVSSLGFFRSSYPWYKMLLLLILVMAFVLNNTYTASLTSLLTTVPIDTQINTVEDFLASGLEILATKIERKLFFDAKFLPKELEKTLLIADRATVDKHLIQMNDSYAYMRTAEQWMLMNQRQKHLKNPIFRVPQKELCTTQFFHRLPLQWDSPFSNSLAIFFMATQETGLSLKWEDMSHYELQKLQNYKSIENDVKPWKPLGLEHFLLAAYLVFSIWILAILCFLGEIFWYNLQGSNTRTRTNNIEAQKSKRYLRSRAGKYYKHATGRKK